MLSIVILYKRFKKLVSDIQPFGNQVPFARLSTTQFKYSMIYRSNHRSIFSKTHCPRSCCKLFTRVLSSLLNSLMAFLLFFLFSSFLLLLLLLLLLPLSLPLFFPSLLISLTAFLLPYFRSWSFKLSRPDIFTKLSNLFKDNSDLLILIVLK